MQFVRFWHKADITIALNHAGYWGKATLAAAPAPNLAPSDTPEIGASFSQSIEARSYRAFSGSSWPQLSTNR
jgi:hypothetical protein